MGYKMWLQSVHHLSHQPILIMLPGGWCWHCGNMEVNTEKGLTVGWQVSILEGVTWLLRSICHWWIGIIDDIVLWQTIAISWCKVVIDGFLEDVGKVISASQCYFHPKCGLMLMCLHSIVSNSLAVLVAMMAEDLFYIVKCFVKSHKLFAIKVLAILLTKTLMHLLCFCAWPKYHLSTPWGPNEECCSSVS